MKMERLKNLDLYGEKTCCRDPKILSTTAGAGER